MWPQQPFRGGPLMHEYNTTSTGYPWRRCTLVLNQGRSLSPLSFLISHTWPLSRVFPGVRMLLRGTPCFTRYSRNQLDPTLRRARHHDNTSFEGSEATTTQLHNHSTLDSDTALPIPPRLSVLSPTYRILDAGARLTDNPRIQPDLTFCRTGDDPDSHYVPLCRRP